jgi:response regulator NasT
MREAMASRAVIEQAKGVLMRDRACTANDAFEVLRELSQHSNRKLHAVAAAVVATTHDQTSPPAPMASTNPATTDTTGVGRTPTRAG